MEGEGVERAAEAIGSADALLVTAGAGMGVDSGLPDFRGNEGFWNAYPPYRKLGKSFVEMANPAGFASDPSLAWGFYGHRLRLYRETEPHEGFGILRQWEGRMGGGCFVMTSNVDGQFQRAGFDPDRVYEVHGSIHLLQCAGPCPGSGIRAADDLRIEVDPETMRAAGDLPRCPSCGGMARPNILLFGDWTYLGDRNDEQRRRLEGWLGGVRDRELVVVELGAGSAVPTVRLFSEEVSRSHPRATLVRINPREPEVLREKDVSIRAGALDALRAIDGRVRGR